MPTFGRPSDSIAVNPTVDRFTASASQTVFTLTNTPASSMVLVWVNGVLQEPTTHYSLSARTLTLGTGCSSGDRVAVEYGTSSSSSGAGNADVRYLNPAATPHAQDREFRVASDLSGAVRVDNSTSNAAAQLRMVVTQSGDSLSIMLNGTVTTDAAGEMHGHVWPYALAVGEALTTHITGPIGRDYNYHFAGPVIADGTTYGSGNQVFYPRWAYNNHQDGLWTGWNTRSAFTDYAEGGIVGPYHCRIKRTATSTWSYEISANGFDWLVIATRTLTMTPSHIGFAGGQWGGTLKSNYDFAYLRVTT